MIIRGECNKEKIDYLENPLENAEIEKKAYCVYYKSVINDKLYFRKCRKKRIARDTSASILFLWKKF